MPAKPIGRKSGLQKIKSVVLSPLTIKVLIIGWLVFVLFNVILAIVYWNKTYPNTTIGTYKLGSIQYTSIDKKISVSSLLPATVLFDSSQKTLSKKVSDLGISVDQKNTANQVKTQRSWLPIINLLDPPSVAIALNTDQETLKKQTDEITAQFKQPATDARIEVNNGDFLLANDKAGWQLKPGQLPDVLISDLSQGKTVTKLKTETIKPAVTANGLKPELKKLEDQLKVGLSYHYKDKTAKPTALDIISWYIPKGASYEVSEDRIKDYLVLTTSNFEMLADNLPQAVSSTSAALKNEKPLDFSFNASNRPIKVIGYCSAVRSVDASYLAGLKSRLQSVYHDSRGWALGGQVILNEKPNGCDFTVWLSAADQMSSFGAICDEIWSCTVGNNVIINFDRWEHASTPWNQSGGSLDEYRSMAINHETGHWFGFGHQGCPAPGQLAPVMEQQSIDLQGCKFNAWPLPTELVALRASLDL